MTNESDNPLPRPLTAAIVLVLLAVIVVAVLLLFDGPPSHRTANHQAQPESKPETPDNNDTTQTQTTGQSTRRDKTAARTSPPTPEEIGWLDVEGGDPNKPHTTAIKLHAQSAAAPHISLRISNPTLYQYVGIDVNFTKLASDGSRTNNTFKLAYYDGCDIDGNVTTECTFATGKGDPFDRTFQQLTTGTYQVEVTLRHPADQLDDYHIIREESPAYISITDPEHEHKHYSGPRDFHFAQVIEFDAEPHADTTIATTLAIRAVPPRNTFTISYSLKPSSTGNAIDLAEHWECTVLSTPGQCDRHLPLPADLPRGQYQLWISVTELSTGALIYYRYGGSPAWITVHNSPASLKCPSRHPTPDRAGHGHQRIDFHESTPPTNLWQQCVDPHTDESNWHVSACHDSAVCYTFQRAAQKVWATCKTLGPICSLASPSAITPIVALRYGKESAVTLQQGLTRAAAYVEEKVTTFINISCTTTQGLFGCSLKASAFAALDLPSPPTVVEMLLFPAKWYILEDINCILSANCHWAERVAAATFIGIDLVGLAALYTGVGLKEAAAIKAATSAGRRILSSALRKDGSRILTYVTSIRRTIGSRPIREGSEDFLETTFAGHHGWMAQAADNLGVNSLWHIPHKGLDDESIRKFKDLVGNAAKGCPPSNTVCKGDVGELHMHHDIDSMGRQVIELFDERGKKLPYNGTHFNPDGLAEEIPGSGVSLLERKTSSNATVTYARTRIQQGLRAFRANGRKPFDCFEMFVGNAYDTVPGSSVSEGRLNSNAKSLISFAKGTYVPSGSTIPLVPDVPIRVFDQKSGKYLFNGCKPLG